MLVADLLFTFIFFSTEYRIIEDNGNVSYAKILQKKSILIDNIIAWYLFQLLVLGLP